MQPECVNGKFEADSIYYHQDGSSYRFQKELIRGEFDIKFGRASCEAVAGFHLVKGKKRLGKKQVIPSFLWI